MVVNVDVSPFPFGGIFRFHLSFREYRKHNTVYGTLIGVDVLFEFPAKLLGSWEEKTQNLQQVAPRVTNLSRALP